MILLLQWLLAHNAFVVGAWMRCTEIRLMCGYIQNRNYIACGTVMQPNRFGFASCQYYISMQTCIDVLKKFLYSIVRCVCRLIHKVVQSVLHDR